ncbi:MAG: Uncharacterized protein AWT59_3067 [Candidatus Gallionella acididurans]|uniref:Uncharacterized protein n=1 Tax=Candidatus Gallionella acididurans TaxID=1796491 RepID=A0A139BP79_9PROT|nr:MAG: Uncharacterized protein AWT59_3067 [Candidatus Gallionella acididurans]
MADLSSIERRKLERLLRMGSGYVLDFSDRTFSEFFEEHTRRDIDATIYRERGTSKVNRNFFRNKCNGIHPSAATVLQFVHSKIGESFASTSSMIDAGKVSTFSALRAPRSSTRG